MSKLTREQQLDIEDRRLAVMLKKNKKRLKRLEKVNARKGRD